MAEYPEESWRWILLWHGMICRMIGNTGVSKRCLWITRNFMIQFSISNKISAEIRWTLVGEKMLLCATSWRHRVCTSYYCQDTIKHDYVKRQFLATVKLLLTSKQGPLFYYFLSSVLVTTCTMLSNKWPVLHHTLRQIIFGRPCYKPFPFSLN
jgi:hypothetical protein